MICRRVASTKIFSSIPGAVSRVHNLTSRLTLLTRTVLGRPTEGELDPELNAIAQTEYGRVGAGLRADRSGFGS